MPSLNLSSDDLAPFADFGTAVQEIADGFVLSRNGVRTEVGIHGDGYVVRAVGSPEQTWLNAGSVLASARFADLVRIAQNQAAVLSSVRLIGAPVAITCEMKQVVGSAPDFVSQNETWKGLDQWLQGLRFTQNAGGSDLLLIDGPAGVGKTTIVREAALGSGPIEMIGAI